MDQHNTYYNRSFQLLPGAGQLLLIAVMVLCWLSSDAQRWEIYFGSNNEDWGHSIVQTRNEGYMIAGITEGFGTGNTGVYVIHTDVDGRKVWERAYDEGHITRGYSIIKANDQGYLIAGEIINVPQVIEKNVYLQKIDDSGDLLWNRQFGGPENESARRVIPSANDGGYLIIGETTSFGNGGSDVYLIKIDDEGNLEWSNTYGTSEDEEGMGAVETIDGYLVVGSGFNSANSSDDIYVFRIDFSGNIIWDNQYYGTAEFDQGADIVATQDGNFALLGNSGGVAQDVNLIKVTPDGTEIWSRKFGSNFVSAQAVEIVSAADGGLVFTGVVEPSSDNNDAFLTRYDLNGNEVWSKIIGRSFTFDWAEGLALTEDGGFAVVGYNSQVGIFNNDVSFIKTNAQGDVYTNILDGKVFIDEDEECDLDVGEKGLREWIVSARSATNTFFGTSDNEGNYSITIDTGIYNVTVYPKNAYWESCVTGYNVNFNSQYDTLTRHFPITKSTLCPLLEVDVSAPVAQNCSNIGYTVDYCNDGTEGVADPTIEIILDENLTMTGASIPFSTVGDSLYVFDLDPLGIDECGSFIFSAESDCNGEPFEALTVRAHIFPDTICTPTTGWDMSDVDVIGFCDTDSIRFEITNKGDDMSQPLNFIVIQDQVMGLQGDFQLNAGETQKTALLADGRTYRMIAEQSPGHPGNSYPTVAVEGCTISGSSSTGIVTQFQEDENDPFLSVDVQEAITPTDYIFMRGYPKGYLEDGDYIIETNTPLQYHIFFQNPGTDTIRRLVIRDTLPEGLDLATVVPGASSHPYQFEAYGNGVLRFTFENLNLSPDSSAASTGFVQFKVSQKPNNPVGTVLPNSAAVFLGYEEPAQTTTVTNMVDSIGVLIQLINWTGETPIPGVEVSAYPNPFTTSIVFEIKENRFRNLTLTVFDMSGRPVRQEKASGSQIQLTRGHLLAGMYAFRLEADGLLLNTGKILVR
ncbi:MAG: T9SS type A sorting domain-containing protein [Bacteroidota bacterium]